MARQPRTGTRRVYTQVRHPEHQHRMGRGRGRARRATDLTPMQFIHRCAEFEYQCAYCGASPGKDKLEVEHLLPLGEGGDHTLSNVIPACRACNAARKTLPLDEWLNVLRSQGVSPIPLLERSVGQAILAGLAITARDKSNV